MRESQLTCLVHELAQRAAGGTEVVLTWDEATDQLTVCVSNDRSGSYFELDAKPDEALDVFFHPYAYAAFRQIRYGDEPSAAWLDDGGVPDAEGVLHIL
jgi:hypothetical protein